MAIFRIAGIDTVGKTQNGRGILERLGHGGDAELESRTVHTTLERAYTKPFTIRQAREGIRDADPKPLVPH